MSCCCCITMHHEKTVSLQFKSNKNVLMHNLLYGELCHPLSHSVLPYLTIFFLDVLFCRLVTGTSLTSTDPRATFGTAH